MKNLFITLCVMVCFSNSVYAVNYGFNNAIIAARSQLASVENIETKWDEFISYLQKNGTYAAMEQKRDSETNYINNLTTEFDQWASNKLVANSQALDEETRKTYDPEYSSQEEADESSSTAAAGGDASSSRSILSKRTAIHSLTSPTRGMHRTKDLLGEITTRDRRIIDLNAQLDWGNDSAIKTRAEALNAADEVVRKQNLKAFLDKDALRASYIQALLLDTTHRNEIAQALVDNEAFRKELIGRMEAGHHAIDAGRMDWFDVDTGDNHADFWANAQNKITTRAAFDHLLSKTRKGYEAITHFTWQREKFRTAFAAGNRLGLTGRDIGSSQAGG